MVHWDLVVALCLLPQGHSVNVAGEVVYKVYQALQEPLRGENNLLSWPRCLGVCLTQGLLCCQVQRPVHLLLQVPFCEL